MLEGSFGFSQISDLLHKGLDLPRERFAEVIEMARDVVGDLFSSLHVKKKQSQSGPSEEISID